MSNRDLYALLGVPRQNGVWLPTALSTHQIIEAHFNQPYPKAGLGFAIQRHMTEAEFMRAIGKFKRWDGK